MNTRRRVMESSLKESNADILDVVFVNNLDSTDIKTFSRSQWPDSGWTPIGIVVIPESHDRYVDGGYAAMSLVGMSPTTPSTGVAVTQSEQVDNVRLQANAKGVLPIETKVDGTNQPAYVLAEDESNIGGDYIYTGTPEAPFPYTDVYGTAVKVYSDGALSKFNGEGMTLAYVISAKATSTNPSEITDGVFPAPIACNRYSVAGVSGWYLPSAGELAYVPSIGYSFNDTINALNEKYGLVGTLLAKSYGYWASTKSSTNSGARFVNIASSTSGYVSATSSGTRFARAFIRLNRQARDNISCSFSEVIILGSGTYKLECWGAQGGSISSTCYGGKGGYSVGELTLNSPTTLYICVGTQGEGGTSTGVKLGGINGGGYGYNKSYDSCGGGGATDIRIGSNSLYARVIVAGGGGGASKYDSTYKYRGGAGGGTSGETGGQSSTTSWAGVGGKQTAAGTSHYGNTTANSTTYGDLAKFGRGGETYTGSTSYNISGGGGGWYGGGYAYRAGAGGGSGYVYTSSTASNYPSGCLLNSSYYLANAQTIAGNASMPSISGGTETGHQGDGFVRITKLS